MYVAFISAPLQKNLCIESSFGVFVVDWSTWFLFGRIRKSRRHMAGGVWGRVAHGRSTGCQLAFSSPLRKVHRFIRWLHNNIISPFPLSDVAQQSAYMFGLSLFEFYAECYQETRTEAPGKKWNTSQGNTTRRWLHNAQGNTAQDDWKWNIEKEDLHPNYPYSPCLQLILWSFSQLSS